MVVVKLLPDPSVDVAPEDLVLEAAASVVEEEEGNDCPLAGIGMTLVDPALAAAVCDA